MTKAQQSAIDDLKAAVKRCHRCGLTLIADIDVPGVRVMFKGDFRSLMEDVGDLRNTDYDLEQITLSEACGGDDTKGSCNGMTMPMHS